MASVRYTAEVASDKVYGLGEGPLWDPVRRRLLWVDITGGMACVGDLRDDGTIRVLERHRFEGTVGAVAVSEEGDLLVAGAEGLFVRHTDGTISPGPRLLPSGSGRRLNDGKPDPAGRYVVGSLRLDGASTSEVLVQIDHDGTVRVVDNDLTLSNGLAWTADGTQLYSIDTERRTVYVRDYDVATGDTGPRSVALQVDAGFPDGMCLDAEEHLWIALWGRGRVHRYSPAGRLVEVVDVPAPHTSSVAFAGPELDTLVITTATKDLTASQLAEHPHSGRLFTVRPGVRGRPEPLWRPFSSTFDQ